MIKKLRETGNGKVFGLRPLQLDRTLLVFFDLPAAFFALIWVWIGSEFNSEWKKTKFYLLWCWQWLQCSDDGVPPVADLPSGRPHSYSLVRLSVRVLGVNWREVFLSSLWSWLFICIDVDWGESSDRCLFKSITLANVGHPSRLISSVWLRLKNECNWVVRACGMQSPSLDCPNMRIARMASYVKRR